MFVVMDSCCGDVDEMRGLMSSSEISDLIRQWSGH